MNFPRSVIFVGLRTLPGAAWQAALRLNQRIEDCWIGDLIGAAALFGLLFVMSFIVGAIQ